MYLFLDRLLVGWEFVSESRRYLMYSKSFSAKDLDVATRTVWGEARGEGEAGRRAVAWVIRNRSEIDLWEDGKADWWGETLSEVCLKKWQFSCWNSKDPNAKKIKKLSMKDEEYKKILLVVVEVLLSPVTYDPTFGACHYHLKGLHPDWIKSGQWVANIGNHVFYSGIR